MRAGARGVATWRTLALSKGNSRFSAPGKYIINVKSQNVKWPRCFLNYCVSQTRYIYTRPRTTTF